MSPADMVLLFLPWKHALASPSSPISIAPTTPCSIPSSNTCPWRMYAVDSLRSGLVPLWNPYSFMGTPFLANLQSTLLYPPNLLFLITGAAHGFGVSAILHLIAGGLFMLAFLRTLGLRPAAATLGALVFMFNGFTVDVAGIPHPLAVDLHVAARRAVDVRARGADAALRRGLSSARLSSRSSSSAATCRSRRIW